MPAFYAKINLDSTQVPGGPSHNPGEQLFEIATHPGIGQKE